MWMDVRIVGWGTRKASRDIAVFFILIMDIVFSGMPTLGGFMKIHA